MFVILHAIKSFFWQQIKMWLFISSFNIIGENIISWFHYLSELRWKYLQHRISLNQWFSRSKNICKRDQFRPWMSYISNCNVAIYQQWWFCGIIRTQKHMSWYHILTGSKGPKFCPRSKIVRDYDGYSTFQILGCWKIIASLKTPEYWKWEILPKKRFSRQNFDRK